ncbi:MAG: EamA family transporter [Pseudomonadota bacterium]|nr:EamA family transporter [Pseudomonadota bacterium]
MNTARQSPRWLPVLSLLFTATLWGVVWYPLRLLQAQGLGGLWSTLISFGAALVVCLWVFVRDRQVLKENARYLVYMAIAAGWCNVAFIMAVLDGTVVRVLLLFYLSPFWAVCLGWLMLGERLDGKSVLVFAIAVCGAMIMLWDERIGFPWPRDESDWLAVSSGFAFALSNVYVRKMRQVGVWLKSASSWLGVVLVTLVWVVVSRTGVPDININIFLFAIALGLFGFLIMTVTVQYGVSRMPVHRSAVILLFELVIGAISSLLLTDEHVYVKEWVGGGMIILAAWIAAHIHAGDRA